MRSAVLKHALVAIAATALASCAEQRSTTGAPPAARPSPAGDSSRNSLDWQGVYVGTIPCADCPGIRMRIELRDDGTFARSLTYLERNVAPFTDSGSFEWDGAGARITLSTPGDDTQQYQVGENVLFMLDRNGQRIAGERADLYRLEKTVNDAQIENRRWRLVELNGRPVVPPTGRAGPYVELDGEQARVTGNASCNQFSGRYDLTSGRGLRFDSNLIATRMACGELAQEQEFFEALGRVDRYAVGDGVLSLSGASAAPLARFRAAGE